MNNYKEIYFRTSSLITTIITQTHFVNTFECTPPPNAVFLVDDEAATLAARGEKANALAEVATSASSANFFMMMAILGDEMGVCVGEGASNVELVEGRRQKSGRDKHYTHHASSSTHFAYVLQARFGDDPLNLCPQRTQYVDTKMTQRRPNLLQRNKLQQTTNRHRPWQNPSR